MWYVDGDDDFSLHSASSVSSAMGQFYSYRILSYPIDMIVISEKRVVSTSPSDFFILGAISLSGVSFSLIDCVWFQKKETEMMSHDWCLSQSQRVRTGSWVYKSLVVLGILQVATFPLQSCQLKKSRKTWTMVRVNMRPLISMSPPTHLPQMETRPLPLLLLQAPPLCLRLDRQLWLHFYHLPQQVVLTAPMISIIFSHVGQRQMDHLLSASSVGE